MSTLESLYQALIIEHSKRPHGKQALSAESESAAQTVLVSHHELNPSCGDEITLEIAYDKAEQQIVDIGWAGDGCSISVASASVLSQLVKKQSLGLDDAQQLIDAFRDMLQSRNGAQADEDLLGDAVAFQGVAKFVMRIKCAMLAWVALEADLKQLRG